MKIISIALLLALTSSVSYAQESNISVSDELDITIGTEIAADADTFYFDTNTSILALAADDDELTILASLLSLTGLDSALDGSLSSELTVFAPTDSAFEDSLTSDQLEALQTEANRDLLIDILTYHVRAGSPIIMSEELFDEENVLVSMMNNKSARITLDDIWWDVDIMASNGVIHKIEMVLIPPSSPTLVEAVQASESHTILAQALSMAPQLVQELSALGNITLFAPTDSAFQMLGGAAEKLLSEDYALQLMDVLMYHVYPGPDLTSSWQVGLTGTMMNGETTSVTDTTPPTINDAVVTGANVMTGNGIIQVIDSVLLPSFTTVSVMDVLTAQAEENDLSTLIQLLVATGLAETLSNTTGGPYTLFAPTDEAFEAITTETFAALSTEELVDLLTLHVTGAGITSMDWNDEAFSMASQEIAVGRQSMTQPEVDMLNGVSVPLFLSTSETPMIGPANLLVTDLIAANGVVHVIDTVITEASLELFTTDSVPVLAEEAATATTGTSGKDDDSLQATSALEDDEYDNDD